MICIYIGKDTVKILRGTGAGNKIKINSSYQVSLPDARFSMEEGDTNNVREKLQEVLSKEKDKNLTFVIDNTSVMLREMEIIETSTAEFEKMIKFQMEQIIPNLDEYVVDYKIIDKTQKVVETESSKTVADGEEKGAKEKKQVSKTYCKVNVFAYRKTYVENYLNMAKQLGAKIIYMDTTPNAVTKLVANYGKKVFGEAPFILIDIENSHINMYLYYIRENNCRCLLTQTINIAKAPASAAGAPKVNVNDIVNNTSRMIQYQSAVLPGDKVSKIFMTGNADDSLMEIQRAIMSNFHIDVDVMPNNINVQSDKNFDIRKYSDMIGAFVRVK